MEHDLGWKKKRLALCGIVVGCRKVHVSCFGNWSRLLGSESAPSVDFGEFSVLVTPQSWCESAWCDLSFYSIAPLPRKKEMVMMLVHVYIVHVCYSCVIGLQGLFWSLSSLIQTSAAGWIVSCSPFTIRDKQIIRCGLEPREAEAERADCAFCSDHSLVVNYTMTSPLFSPPIPTACPSTFGAPPSSEVESDSKLTMLSFF